MLSGPPLIAGTQAKPGDRWWCDSVGHFNGTEWTAPNGTVNIDDVLAGIFTFQDPNALDAAHLSRMDFVPALDGLQINKIVGTHDFFRTILGFQGNEYPGPLFE